MSHYSNIYRKIRQTMTVAALVAATTACSWVSDDLQPCPTGLKLRFVYDYNMMRSDVFHSQVREVTAYVFGADDKLVTVRTEDNPAVLGTYGYEMEFDDLAPGNYRVMAFAFQKPEEKRLATPGAKFRIPSLTPGDSWQAFQVKLDREKNQANQRTAREGSLVNHQQQPLDTLWINYKPQTFTITDQEILNHTVELMRDTKQLTVSLRQIDDPTAINCNDYDIYVTDRNGLLGPDNQVLEDEMLCYTPFFRWNTDFKDEAGTVVQRAAHAELSLSRLIYHPQWQQNARLRIVHKSSGKTVADINLPDYLAQGRGALELQYSPQEFLDREHVYKLDFFLKGDTWEFVDLHISVLNWSVRIQNVNL